MEILEGEEDILQVYHGIDDEIGIIINYNPTIFLTPMEAMQLRDLLSKLIIKTEYFKGLKYE